MLSDVKKKSTKTNKLGNCKRKQSKEKKEMTEEEERVVTPKEVKAVEGSTEEVKKEEEEEEEKEEHYIKSGFVIPEKRIHMGDDFTKFKKSPTYLNIMGFIRTMNNSVLGVPTTSPDIYISPAVQDVLGLLDKVSALADETEPLPAEKNRFGNKAFRTFHEKLIKSCFEMNSTLLSAHMAAAFGSDGRPLPAAAVEPVVRAASEELGPYLLDSFGNPVRLDYGTGHELHFVMYLYCLRAIGVLKKCDHQAMVLRIFVKYIDLCRKIRARYNQEPAGSHGVWSLDDYNFIPYIWGSAQLVNHPSILPDSVLDPLVIEQYKNDYMYLNCIAYTCSVKSGPFFEHSPDLYNITAAASWKKINGGMHKKYEVDVLSKWPVIQHFLFGSIIPCTWESSPVPPSKSPNSYAGNVNLAEDAIFAYRDKEALLHKRRLEAQHSTSQQYEPSELPPKIK